MAQNIPDPGRGAPRNSRRPMLIVLLGIASISALCSCASHKEFNLSHQASPSRTALLIIREEKGYVLPVAKVDEHKCFLPRTTLASADNPNRSADVRLDPGPHVVKVTFRFAQGNCLTGKTIPFEASEGKQYELSIKLLDVKPGIFLGTVEWEAKITEVDTAKEFLPDGHDFKVDPLFGF